MFRSFDARAAVDGPTIAVSLPQAERDAPELVAALVRSGARTSRCHPSCPTSRTSICIWSPTIIRGRGPRDDDEPGTAVQEGAGGPVAQPRGAVAGVVVAVMSLSLPFSIAVIMPAITGHRDPDALEGGLDTAGVTE